MPSAGINDAQMIGRQWYHSAKGGKPKLKQIILICASLVLAAPAVRESRGQRWIKDLAGKISYSAVEQSSLICENYIAPFEPLSCPLDQLSIS